MRFVECLVETRAFSIGQRKAYPELQDETWLVKQMFPADIITHLNELNFCPQDAGQIVMCLFELRKGFVSKLDIRTRDIKQKLFSTIKLIAYSVDGRINAVEIDI